jgi:5-hydroxyisourate hydrolase-like protein (transthyretin family)
MSGKSNAITTHVLDTALGKPARGLAIKLFFQIGETFTQISEGFGHSVFQSPFSSSSRLTG